MKLFTENIMHVQTVSTRPLLGYEGRGGEGPGDKATLTANTWYI